MLKATLSPTKYKVQFIEHKYRNTFTYTDDEHTIQVFQTEVLRMSGPRRDEAVYDLVMREGLWIPSLHFMILMKLPTE